MIGRAAIGNPYLFKSINHYLKTGEILKKQTYEEKVDDFLEYIKFSKKYNYTNIQPIKMQAQNFVKGYVGSGKIRDKVSKCRTVDEIIDVLRNTPVSP
jgi:tRNA-dihydrouridine synthase B